MKKWYVCPVVIAYVVCKKAAFGENVPAKPPDSFHAARLGAPASTATKIATSWLNPAVAVQRSTFALTMALVLAAGVMSTLRLVASIATQLAPSLLCR